MEAGEELPWVQWAIAGRINIDELDALCPSRGENVQDSGGSSGEGGEESNLNTRAVAALTEIFDGNVVNLDGIVVLATTNRPDAVDVGLRRVP